MGRILDARGDEALDVLAELLGPVGEIAADPEIAGMMKTGGGGTMLDLAKAMLKNHKAAVVEIMAIDDSKTPDEERGIITALTIPGRLMKLLSVPAVSEMLFGSAATNPSGTGSSAASGKGKE